MMRKLLFDLELLGYSAAIFSAISFLPQATKMYKSRSVKDISLSMYVVYLISLVLWLLYGIKINSIHLIVSELFTLVLVVIILVMKYLWQNK